MQQPLKNCREFVGLLLFPVGLGDLSNEDDITVVMEIGAGALLLGGFRTRLMAWVLAAFTVVAAVLFHRDFGDPNQAVHFLKNLAIAGGLVHIAAIGGGAFSLDGVTLGGRRSAA